MLKVLIRITTKNRAAILPKAIESALNQDYPHTEIAVFDDASTDETPLLQAQFPAITWYRVEKNQGYLAARNQMMRDTDADLYFSLDETPGFKGTRFRLEYK
jgi:glycosyltransferase involved in cell wall biosynthesis